MTEQRQRGFVLLQVMLVFSVLIVLVAQVQYKQRIHVKRTTHSLFLSQAQTYIDSATAIVEVALTMDAEDNSTDHLYELWNQQIPGLIPKDVEGVAIAFEINDLQGRFNVNWLHTDNSNRQNALKAFKKLLATLEAESGIGEELYKWFDEESGVDYDYSDEEPSYSPSFHEMADISELMLLKKVDQEQFDIIKPYLSALPVDSKLNINTAPAEILMSVASFVTEANAEDAIKKRDDNQEGFSNVSDFTGMSFFTNKNNKNTDPYIPTSELTLATEWFDLFTAVTIAENIMFQRSVIHRNSEGNTVLTMRDRAVNESNPIPGDPNKTQPLSFSSSGSQSSSSSNTQNGSASGSGS